MFVNGSEVSNENIVIFNGTELLKGQKYPKFMKAPVDKQPGRTERVDWEFADLHSKQLIM